MPVSERRITLLTPTYAGDLQRFAAQRASIEALKVDLPHVAVVHDEDLPRFRDLPHQRGLTLVSTREVLGRAMEARRRSRPHRRLHPMHWLGPRPLHGWMSQQLVKLAADRVVETPAYVCVDSDTLLLRRVTADDFYTPDGRLHLYESTDDADAEMAGWTYEAMRFLRLPLRAVPLYRYTHVPVPIRVETVRSLQKRIERVAGGDWMQAMDRRHVTEYAAYGAFARYGAGLEGLHPTPPPLSLYFWWPHEADALEATFAERAADERLKFVTLQSKRPDRVAALQQAVAGFRRRGERAGAATVGGGAR